MRAHFLFLLPFALIIGSCSQPEKFPLDGAWKCVSGVVVNGDIATTVFPAEWSGSLIKIYSGNYLLYVGEFRKDSIVMDNYGGSRITWDGNKGTSTILYHVSKEWVGRTTYGIYEIKGDTLIETYDTSEKGEIDSTREYHIDKFVRL